MRCETLAGEAVLAPDRMVAAGQRLEDDALRQTLLEPHAPSGRCRLEPDRPREVGRDREDSRPARRQDASRVDVDTPLRPADAPDRGVEDDPIAEPLRESQREELRAADDSVGEALIRLEQLVRAARACD